MTIDKIHTDLTLNIRPFSRKQVDTLMTSLKADGFDASHPIVVSGDKYICWEDVTDILVKLGLDAPADAPEWLDCRIPVSGWHRLLACCVTGTEPVVIESTKTNDYRAQAMANQLRQQQVLRMTGPAQVQAIADMLRDGTLNPGATALERLGFKRGTAQTLENRAKLVVAGICDADAACKLSREDAALAFAAGGLPKGEQKDKPGKALSHKDYAPLLAIAPMNLVPLLTMLSTGQQAMAMAELKAMNVAADVSQAVDAIGQDS